MKVKGNIHWISKKSAYQAKVRLYSKLFTEERPGTGNINFIQQINKNSCITIIAQLEESLQNCEPGEQFQFERNGYFIADIKDSKKSLPIFNQTVTLKENN